MVLLRGMGFNQPLGMVFLWLEPAGQWCLGPDFLFSRAGQWHHWVWLDYFVGQPPKAAVGTSCYPLLPFSNCILHWWLF
ncbi:unnamed protein product [Cuscuta campestris]|uniref:Uncharacterized protein n=1 Tax=Cuscuta campestris TaxID=132261 RepID=A0A484LEB9_9ASTE|nr:unnamed protein product [Cuscuta campestris]